MPRRIAAVVVTLIGMGAPADAAGHRPQIHRQEPYVKARARLIAQGYLPVRFSLRRGEFPCENDPETCKSFPENLYCEGSTYVVCAFIFQHRTTGRLWQVLTEGEVRQRVIEVSQADPCEFTGATAQLPDGRRLIYRRSC